MRPWSLLISAHHKCATEWTRQYLEKIAAENELRLHHTHRSFDTWSNDADLQILSNASYDVVSEGLGSSLHVIRNPLDVIVSAYHSHKETHSVLGWPELERQRQVLRSIAQEDGMLLTTAFIERSDFHSEAIGPLHALRSWDFEDDRFVTVRMEDMVNDPTATIGAYIAERWPNCVLPDPASMSFEAMTGRKPGEIDPGSHYRSGKAEQWRTVLPPSLIQYVRAHYTSILGRFYPEALSD
jgi:hypothetical protein